MRSWIVGLFLLSIVGAVLIIVGGTTLVAIGVACMGIAAVGAVSLMFFAVGKSEDDARAEEQIRRNGSEPGDTDGRLNSRRPPRSRGDA